MVEFTTNKDYQKIGVDTVGARYTINGVVYKNNIYKINEIPGSMTHASKNIVLDIYKEGDKYYFTCQGDDGGITDRDIERLTCYYKETNENDRENMSLKGTGVKTAGSKLTQEHIDEHQLEKASFYIVSKNKNKYNGIEYNVSNNESQTS